MITLKFKIRGCFIFFLVLAHSAIAQNGDFFIGVVKDSMSNEAIPFATLLVKGQRLGVITNTDGTFKIPTFFKSMGDTLLVSSMGYSSKEVVISRLNKSAIRNYGKESFSFIDNLASDFINTHTFKLKKTTVYNKQAVYEIDLVYRDDTYLATGSIFINKEDFSIYKLDYSVSKRKKPATKGIAVNEAERHSDGFKKTSHELVYHIVTEYIKGNDKKMYLNYISFYNKMLVKRPPAFKSRFIIDFNDFTFKIRINNIPARLSHIKNKDFIITYKNQQIPIEEFYFSDEKRTFVVCPHIRYKPLAHVFKELFTATETLGRPHLKYGFRNIKDVAGNNLDEQKLEFMHQYREFFTQQVVPDKELFAEDGTSFMIKTAPLDNPSQPIVEGEMKNEYWMNTPLPGLKP